MKHIKKIKSYSMVGSLGLTVTALLQGCGEGGQDSTMPPAPESNMESLQGDLQEQNYFLVIEQTGTSPDKYQLAEKHPTQGATRAVLRGLDGTETILSNEELTALAEAEAAKVDAGTSNLTQPQSEASSGGMSLGEMVLASAAGALIGGMLANKLSQNQNYRNNQKANTRPAAQVSQPGKQRSAPSAKQKSTPKSGFGGRQGGSSSGSAKSFGG